MLLKVAVKPSYLLFWVFKYRLPKMLILIIVGEDQHIPVITKIRAFKHHVLFPLLKAPLCNQLEFSRKILKFSRRLQEFIRCYKYLGSKLLAIIFGSPHNFAFPKSKHDNAWIGSNGYRKVGVVIHVHGSGSYCVEL